MLVERIAAGGEEFIPEILQILDQEEVAEMGAQPWLVGWPDDYLGGTVAIGSIDSNVVPPTKR